VQIETVCNGVVHGAVRLFSEAGTLMASASQSLILRFHDAENQQQQADDE
jgi:acyl-CoA thioesterase